MQLMGIASLNPSYALPQAGEGARIRVFFTCTLKNVDGRDKPGHDEQRRLDPGSAAHHFVLRRARETRSVVEEAPQLP
jgi:hypothetical protein